MRKLILVVFLFSLCFLSYGCANDQEATNKDDVSADEMKRAKVLQAATSAEEAQEAVEDEQADDMTNN